MRKMQYMSDGYQHRSHNKNLLMIHLILVTKYRKQILKNIIDTDVKKYIYEICVRKHWYIRRMQSDKDHIHILLQYNPTDSVSNIVATIKQYSTYHMWAIHASALHKHYWKEHTFWSDGYFACSIGRVSQATIEHYIENQG